MKSSVIVLVVIVLVLIYLVSSYNRLIRLNVGVDEAYPDLKASSNFLALQEELSTTENKVSFSRQFYNDNVRSLNQSVKTFPGNLFAGVAKVIAREFYQVEDPQDRKAPNVKF